jgi:ribonuclease P protein component
MIQRKIEVLKKRADFLRVSRLGVPARTSSVVVLFAKAACCQGDNSEVTVGTRVGYTASKKCGGAVLRNRAKRRFRALVHEFRDEISSLPGELVFIATRNTPTADPKTLRSDFSFAIRKLRKMWHAT